MTEIEMPVAVLQKLISLNEDAVKAVSPVGGNSVQEGYRENTLKVLAEQKTDLELFLPDE